MKSTLPLNKALLLLFLFSAPTFAAHTLLLTPFSNGTQKKEHQWITHALFDVMHNDLSAIKKFALYDKKKSLELMPPFEIPFGKPVKAKTAMLMGRVAKVEHILIGSYDVIGGTVTLVARVVERKSGDLIRTVVSKASLRSVFKAEKNVLLSLIDFYGVKPSPQERGQLMQIPTTSVEAFKRYGWGLHYQQLGKEKKAKREFKKAIDLDANYQAPFKQLIQR